MPLIDSQPDALANVYATSLYQLADAEGGRTAVETTLAELEDVAELTRSNPAFAEFLASRSLPAASRGASLKRIFSGRVSPRVLHFLLLLNDNGRLSHLLPIIGALDAQCQSAFGRVEVDVDTASPIDAAELAVIRDQLKAVLGKDPILHARTDPSMLGGVRLRIGDQLIDASVATRLRKMRDRLAQEGSARIRAAARTIIEG